MGATFQKKCETEKVCLDCAGVDGLHMSPPRGELRATWEVSDCGVWRQLGWNLGGEICGEGMFHDIEALWVDSVTSSAIRLNT